MSAPNTSRAARAVADAVEDPLSVMVVGVDGSGSSQRAAAYAIALARPFRSRLVFTYVFNTSSLVGLAPQLAGQEPALAAEIAAELQTSLQQTMAGWEGDWEFRAFVGNPFIELCKTAMEVEARAIVVGASHRRNHQLAGSLAVHMVKSGRLKVIVVP